MPLFRTMLFAADFSERSKDAFRVACALANESKTRLIVVHVVDELPVKDEQRSYGEQVAAALIGDGSRVHTEKLKDRLREDYVPPHAIDVTYYIRFGATRDELLLMADEFGADLIVMGTHGRTGLRRLLAGSVAEAVLRDAPCPVLALRSSELVGITENFRVILHPTDFSECSESALEVARFLAREHGARLIVVNVAPIEILMNGTTAVANYPQLYREALEQMTAEVDGPDLKYPLETQSRQGSAEAQILQAAAETGCDLIVMGTAGRSGLGRVLMGSVAEGVLRKAHCPVLTVKMPVPAAIATASPTACATA